MSIDSLPIFQAARQAIAQKSGVALDQVVLISYEPVDWPDSCLGAAQANEMCLQVITPGYLAFFDTPQGQIEVHLDKSGRMFRLITPGIFTTIPASGTSGIEGRVWIGPACPGPQSLASPCPDQPYQATITILKASDEVVARVQSDQQGYFRLELPPGTYVLRPESGAVMPRAPEQTVAVLPGQFTPVQIVYDSGMR
jgi:hypothetical protein